MAAVNGPNNQKYVQTITTNLDQETQSGIAQIIQQVRRTPQYFE